MSIEAYDYGRKDGIAEERKRIRDWILANRSEFQLDDDLEPIYRDHFSSTSLLRFIDEQEED